MWRRGSTGHSHTRGHNLSMLHYVAARRTGDQALPIKLLHFNHSCLSSSGRRRGVAAAALWHLPSG